MENFDLEIAKKILRGEVVGGFVTRNDEPAEIIFILEDDKFAGHTTRYPIFAISIDRENEVAVNSYTKEGRFYDDGDECDLDLFITYDRRRKGVKRKSATSFCTNKKLEGILQRLVYSSPACKIKGREDEGKKELSGVYRAGDTLYACVDELEDIVEIDNIIMEEEEKN